jgi:Na+:H+ antiporter, NhaA family
LSRIWTFIIDNSLLLVAGTVTGLIWANVDHASYDSVAGVLRFPVNDFGMVFFFALATKQIVEAMLPGGPLASWREAAMPLMAAVGGMAVPASAFALQARLLDRPDLTHGWAIPCATDIAFSYMAARVIFPREHPAIPFLLLLAIADDALGLILLAVAYPSGQFAGGMLVGLMIPAILIAWQLHRRRIQSFWAYVIGAGTFSWSALYFGGIHPALALVPIVPFMPHAARDMGLFDPREDALLDTMNRFEHWWKVPVHVILLFFGFANAGVELSRIGPVTWIVFWSLLLGKPVGIVCTALASSLVGLRLPKGLTLPDTVVVGIACGIGFTVALFFATAAFPPGHILDEAKMGALLSFVAAPLAILAGIVVRQRSR